MDDVRHSGGIEKERIISMSNYKENAEFVRIVRADKSVELRFQSRGERGHIVKTQKEEE